MKNMWKINSRKENVSNCGALDCYEKQTDKEVEVYRPISEDTEPQVEANRVSKLETNKKENTLPTTSESAESVADKKPETETRTDMVQEETNNVNDGADEQMLGAEDNEKLADKREEVKFIKGDHQNGDAKIDIGAVNGKAFTGMTKEELMKYANDPFWIRLRWIFFIAFWLVWLGMLVGAILIIVGAPKCAAPEPLPWYKRGVLAKFPSFEANKENVDLAKQVEATGVIYEMPAELTYNIREPAVEEKIKEIINHYKGSDAHVIFDVTANYVPKSSRLMQDAVADESKRSAFIWIEKSAPPNNWVSLVNGSAWSEVSPGNYVLSQFGDGLYDLHMNDTIVRKELDDVLKHLVELGVHGIRLKNTKFFLLSKQIRDEVPGEDPKYDLTQYGFWTHTQTTFQEGLGDVLYEYLTVVKNTSTEAFLSVAEDIIRPEIYRTSTGEMSVDMPMYGNFVKSLGSPKDKPLRSELLNILRDTGNHTWMQWNVADVSVTSEVDPSSLTLFLSLLPGTPVVSLGSDESSNLTDSIYKTIAQCRMSPSYMHGDFDLLSIDPMLGYTRIKAGNPGYLVVFNPTDITQKVNITSENLPDQLTVVTASTNFNVTNIGQKAGQRIALADLELSPYSTIILTYVSKKMG